MQESCCAPKQQSQSQASGFEQIVIEQNSDETKIVCDICQFSDDFEEDELVICGLCQVGVHQTCYGGELIRPGFDPQGNEDWYCHRCRELVMQPSAPIDSVSCIFCPSVQGAIKQVLYCGSKIWAHINCVNWLCGLWFDDEEKFNVVGELIQRKRKGQKTQRCGECHRTGGLFTCDYQSCKRQYHVRCAVKLGIIYSYEQMNIDYSTLDDPEQKNIFCNQHRNQMLTAAKKKSIKKAKTPSQQTLKKRKFSDYKKCSTPVRSASKSAKGSKSKSAGKMGKDVEKTLNALEKERLSNLARNAKLEQKMSAIYRQLKSSQKANRPQQQSMAKNLGKKGRISASQPNHHHHAQASQSEERNRSETAFFPAFSGGNEQAEEKDVKEEDTNSNVIIVESSSEEVTPARRLF